MKVRRRLFSAVRSCSQKSQEKVTSVVQRASLSTVKEFPTCSSHSASQELLDYIWAARRLMPLKATSNDTRNSCRNVPMIPRAALIPGQPLNSKYPLLYRDFVLNNFTAVWWHQAWLTALLFSVFMYCTLVRIRNTTTPHHNHFTALFPGPPAWAGARRELLDIMVQEKINTGRRTNHPAGRHSIRTNQCLPPPFYGPEKGCKMLCMCVCGVNWVQVAG